MNHLKWLYPGMHVKRWLFVLTFGVVVIGLGIAYILREFYEVGQFPDWVYYATIQFLPRYVRGSIMLALGIGFIAFSIVKLNSSLLAALWPAGHGDSLVDAVYQYRFRRRGPKIVAIGGGTGLSTLLRGLKEYSSNITAIVTVADDGGSSGRLRRELGVLPPGDFRNCIAALAEAEPLMTKLFQYRFEVGSGLEGHSFGNLFIVAMSEVTGSFEQAILESSRVLAVRGRVLPATLANVTLCASMETDEVVRGESAIAKTSAPIRRVFLEPSDVQAHPEAIQAIHDADMIVLGPGSLYTSVMPNLLVEGIRRAIRRSAATKVYVCNVATQRGETDGYRVQDHVEAIHYLVGPDVLQFVLINSNTAQLPSHLNVQPVVDGDLNIEGITPIYADVVDPDNRLRHDPVRLAHALMQVYYDHAQAPQTASAYLEAEHPVRVS